MRQTTFLIRTTTKTTSFITLALLCCIATACATPPTPTITATHTPRPLYTRVTLPAERATLPPTWTPTFTPTITDTPTITPTPTLTPTLDETAICDQYGFVWNDPNGIVYRLGDVIEMSTFSNQRFIGLTFRAVHEDMLPDSDDSIELTLDGGSLYPIRIDVARFPVSGRYDWQASAVYRGEGGYCERRGYFSIDLTTPTATATSQTTATLTPEATPEITLEITLEIQPDVTGDVASRTPTSPAPTGLTVPTLSFDDLFGDALTPDTATP